MQVLNSTSTSRSLTPLNRSTQADKQPVRAIEQGEQAKKSPQQVNRLDVNEQAIALFEQQVEQETSKQAGQQAEQQFGQQLEQQTAQQLAQNADPQGSNGTGYDQPNNQNLNAVATYQSVNNIAQRDSVQQLFGVDLFA